MLAIAHKELKAYFASPIAYVVIGFFALMFGYFYWALLGFFVEQGQRMMGLQGGPTQNVNDQMIRPVFMNASVLLLFALPMMTMRTYSEEKRSGTIELLLTSPLTDVQIIMGKFLGAMALYAAMLARHPGPYGRAVRLRQSGMEAAGHGLSRHAADGRLLRLGGAADLEPDAATRSSPVMVTFAVFLMLWVINWVGPFMGPRDAGGARLPRRSPVTSTTSRAGSSTPATWSIT